MKTILDTTLDLFGREYRPVEHHKEEDQNKEIDYYMYYVAHNYETFTVICAHFPNDSPGLWSLVIHKGKITFEFFENSTDLGGKGWALAMCIAEDKLEEEIEAMVSQFLRYSDTDAYIKQLMR